MTYDRSEELYARIAAIPPGRRLLYNLLAILSVAVLIGIFCFLAINCSRKGAPVFAIVVLSDAIGIAVSFYWFLVSHPSLLRRYGAIPKRTRQIAAPCILVAIFVLKAVLQPVYKPFFDRLDLEHAQRCGQLKGGAYAGSYPAYLQNIFRDL